jgi:hypothetical protein
MRETWKAQLFDLLNNALIRMAGIDKNISLVKTHFPSNSLDNFQALMQQDLRAIQCVVKLFGYDM